MLIAIDIDEVLADTLNSFLVFYNGRHGTSFQRASFDTYFWWTVLGCTREEAIEEFYLFMRDRGSRISLVDGAAEAIDCLRKDHRLIALTSRQNDFKDLTRRWLEEHFDGAFSDVYFTNHYAKNGQKELHKLDIGRELGVELFIEDQLTHAEPFAREGIRVFLFDCPWNQSDLGETIERVFSWDEILEKIA